MRRSATGLLVAAVAVLGAVAVADAIRSDAPGPDAPPPAAEAVAPEADPELVGELRALGVGGTLVYSDPACRSLHAVAVPSLAGVRLPVGNVVEPCSFSLSPDGSRVAAPHWRWSPDGENRAACRGRAFVDVVGPGVGSVRTWDGCTPAWRPDGTLTLVRDGAIVGADGATLVPRGTLLDAAAGHPATPASGRIGGVDVLDVVWRTADAADVLLVVRYPDGRMLPHQLVAGFEGGRLAQTQPVDPIQRLVPGPEGILAAEPGTVLRLPSSARSGLPAALEGSEAIAFSPDGRWVAAVRDGAVDLVPLQGSEPVRLPIAARDLAWR